jgi:phosphatidylglycerol---prolipoprotein diacylglyceryl transferase
MSDLTETARQSGPILRTASNEKYEPPSATKWRPLAILDWAISWSNQLSFWGISYKPYWMMCDVATVLALAYALAFSAHFPSTSPIGLIAAIIVAMLAYKLVRELKTAFGKSSARSFLQDSLFIIIPSFLIISLLFKQRIDLMLAFLGTLMPLYGCLARVGCFLGGCCYGKQFALGVQYPDWIFESSNSGCRKYSPSPNPNGRVFPIQLLEAAAQATLFASLFILIWKWPLFVKYIFWLYLSLYAIVRFVLDFFRTTSARRRRGSFSEAQCFCIAVIVISLTFLIGASVGLI